ncbi:transglutaminase-like cysteine peptidase protein [Rhizobium phage RHph_I4]|nr:transglutaminase-like cysteine peptidase protein [Rhizobium phage RHph_I4]
MEVFCEKYRTNCAPQGSSIVMQTDTLLADLNMVNKNVNASIKSKPDRYESWDLYPQYGDCDDYVMSKRDTLIKMGYPVSALRLFIVRPYSGAELHLVLVVVTDRSLLVLDNLSQDIKRLEETGYGLVLYSTEDPMVWVRVPKGNS